MLQIALTRYGTLAVVYSAAGCLINYRRLSSIYILSFSFSLCFFSRQFVIIHRRSIPRTRRVSLVKSSNEYRSRWTLSGNLPIRLPLLRLVYVTYASSTTIPRNQLEEGSSTDLTERVTRIEQSGQPAISYLNHGQLTNHPLSII